MKHIKRIIGLILIGTMICVNVFTSLARPATESPKAESPQAVKEHYQQLVTDNPNQIKKVYTRSSFQDENIKELHDNFNLLYQIADGSQDFQVIQRYVGGPDESAIIYDQSTQSYMLSEFDSNSDELTITIGEEEFLFFVDSDENMVLSSSGNTMNILWNSEKIAGENDSTMDTRASWVVDPADPTGGYSEYNSTAILTVVSIVAFVADMYTYKVTSVLFHAAITFTTAVTIAAGMSKPFTLYIKEWRYVKSDCVLYGRKVIKYWDNPTHKGTPNATEDFNYWLAQPAGSGCSAYPYP